MKLVAQNTRVSKVRMCFGSKLAAKQLKTLTSNGLPNDPKGNSTL